LKLIEENKYCKGCNTEKPLSEFYIFKTKYKQRLRCKICYRTYQNLYYSKNRERVRQQNRKSEFKNNYGISLEDYEILLKEQNYNCAICGKNEKDCPKGRLYVDHCHALNKVRGLLCLNCNAGIGSLKESIEILKNSIYYLEKNGNL
jgi:hypothetical protein